MLSLASCLTRKYYRSLIYFLQLLKKSFSEVLTIQTSENQEILQADVESKSCFFSSCCSQGNKPESFCLLRARSHITGPLKKRVTTLHFFAWATTMSSRLQWRHNTFWLTPIKHTICSGHMTRSNKRKQDNKLQGVRYVRYINWLEYRVNWRNILPGVHTACEVILLWTRWGTFIAWGREVIYCIRWNWVNILRVWAQCATVTVLPCSFQDKQ